MCTKAQANIYVHCNVLVSDDLAVMQPLPPSPVSGSYLHHQPPCVFTCVRRCVPAVECLFGLFCNCVYFLLFFLNFVILNPELTHPARIEI